jgi:hypothetical protein
MRYLIAAIALVTAAATVAQASEIKNTGLGNVVEFDVIQVAAPPALPGVCAVAGVTTRVWQGSVYHGGQPLLLSVPCAEYGLVNTNVRFDGVQPVNVHSLQQSQHGIARLSDQGELLWQDEGHKNYGAWGQVAGYRVLDARMLPAMPS